MIWHRKGCSICKKIITDIDNVQLEIETLQ